MNYSDYTNMTLSQIPTWVIILYVVVFVLAVVAEWKVYAKAGVPGWLCLIPFVSSYYLFKIAYGNGWRFLTLFIPFANIVFMILLYVELSRSFGLPGVFALGLLFLSIIFWLIMAFSDDIQYVGNKKDRTTYATT